MFAKSCLSPLNPGIWRHCAGRSTERFIRFEAIPKPQDRNRQIGTIELCSQLFTIACHSSCLTVLSLSAVGFIPFQLSHTTPYQRRTLVVLKLNSKTTRYESVTPRDVMRFVHNNATTRGVTKPVIRVLSAEIGQRILSDIPKQHCRLTTALINAMS